jgi:aldehyde:ferredoxin oxidoreductase
VKELDRPALAVTPLRGGPIGALRYLLSHLAEDPLAIVAGSLAGVDAPGTAQCAAVGISPLSGAVAETRAEGPVGPGLRAAGVDGNVLTGASPSPVYVLVADGSFEVLPAEDLWGRPTGAATDALLARHGSAAAVAVIGPAGENLVRYASILTCRYHALPRLGLGAVLGAKNVKAIVCTGARRPAVRSPDVVASVAAAYRADLPGNKLAAWQKDWPGFGVWTGDPGYAPVRNFSDTTRPGGVDAVPPGLPSAVAACPDCPTDCIKVYGGAGLHQEAAAMLGPNLGVGDPWPLLLRCQELGLDPVSLGGTLAAAGMAPSDVPGAVERIAAGGDPLGEGAARAFPGTAMTSMRVELPPFDPRVQPNLGLAYVVSPLGPRYDLVEHDLDFDPADGLPSAFGEVRALGISVPRPRGELDVHRTAQLLRLWSGLDALGMCVYASTPTRPLRLTRIVELAEAVTGARPDVLALGGLRLQLMHQVNQRLGVPPGQLPDRFFTEPVRAGRFAGAVLDRVAFDAAATDLRSELGLV